ncbi:MAG TPA: hypothetical protein VE954_36115 [Oligoflexus sp.]|uniref:hypothetical protein n=1 Tax=Oligoflexus sp. TaxID=1971216 RepID=UPI002D3D0C23|nr:hypothetical protein [Oligoflexus sp.]HYX38560.1 hypothetical protein [Oligoflexus sp.]
MSRPADSRKVLVSIDFSDIQQVTLRPISSGLDDIATYLADPQGNVIAETATNSNTQPRVLAILQNENSPVEVTLQNAVISDYSYENRVVADSKRNLWRFSRQYLGTGYTVKAERLILARDLEGRPTLMPLATLTQTVPGLNFRFDSKTWNANYQGKELFAFTGLLAVTDAAAGSMQLLQDTTLQTGNMRQTLAALDSVNGKVLSYLETYSNGNPAMVVYDVADAAGKASVVAPDSKAIYGAMRSLKGLTAGGFELETLDGPNFNIYTYDAVNSQGALTKTIRMDTDNRVRILVPVTSIP